MAPRIIETRIMAMTMPTAPASRTPPEQAALANPKAIGMMMRTMMSVKT